MSQASSQDFVRECRIDEVEEKVDAEMESIESSMKRWTWNEVEKCWELKKNGQIDADEQDSADGVDQLNGLGNQLNIEVAEAQGEEFSQNRNVHSDCGPTSTQTLESFESLSTSQQSSEKETILRCNKESSLQASSQHLVRECRIDGVEEKVDNKMESIESSMERWTWNEVEKCWELMKNGQINGDEGNAEVGEECGDDESEDGDEHYSNIEGGETHDNQRPDNQQITLDQLNANPDQFNLNSTKSATILTQMTSEQTPLMGARLIDLNNNVTLLPKSRASIQLQQIQQQQQQISKQSNDQTIDQLNIVSLINSSSFSSQILNSVTEPIPNDQPKLENQVTEKLFYKCEWTMCDRVFGGLEDLQTHILDVHVGGFDEEGGEDSSELSVETLKENEQSIEQLNPIEAIHQDESTLEEIFNLDQFNANPDQFNLNSTQVTFSNQIQSNPYSNQSVSTSLHKFSDNLDRSSFSLNQFNPKIKFISKSTNLSRTSLTSPTQSYLEDINDNEKLGDDQLNVLEHRENIEGTESQGDQLVRNMPRGQVVVPGNSQTGKNVCVHCGNGFRERSKLTRHIRKHTGDRPYVCPHENCTKAFTQIAAMRVHHMIHTGERPHVCNQCGKGFRTKYELTLHIPTHTGERPYECPHENCTKTFIRIGAMRNHHMIHTGELPHVCNQCRKRFQAKADLTRHIRSHTGERPYECPLCGMSFIQNSALKTHLMIHTGERPHVCEQCRKSFRTKSNLKKHLNLHHPVKLNDGAL